MSGTLNKGSLIKSSGGSGGGGSASFPTIVTDSGSSLPSASGFQFKDTFLNTSNKKIYTTTANSYELNTNVTNTATVNFTTGVASDFSSGKIKREGLVNLWYGNKNYTTKFKITSINNNTSTIVDYEGNNASPGEGVCFCLSNKKLHYIQYQEQYGNSTAVTDTEISDYVFETNKLYTLNINKEGTSCNIVVLCEELSVINETIDTIEIGNYSRGAMTYGGRWASAYWYFSGLEVYLLDSSGEFLKPSSELSWDSGTDLTDKTEYADKTNGILYLYENEVLNAIPNLEDYKKKAETITISTASVTVSEIKANTNYVFSNSAITDITLSGCETSFEETSIEFTLPADISNFNFIDNSGITWVDGSPTFNASKSYLIVIFNKLGFVKEY